MVYKPIIDEIFHAYMCLHLHVCVNPGKSGVCLSLRTHLNPLAEDREDGVVT